MEKIRFDNQVAIITGAGRGIGFAHAKLLGSRGAKLVINATKNADDAVNRLSEMGIDAVAVNCDISVMDNAVLASGDNRQSGSGEKRQ